MRVCSSQNDVVPNCLAGRISFDTETGFLAGGQAWRYRLGTRELWNAEYSNNCPRNLGADYDPDQTESWESYGCESGEGLVEHLKCRLDSAHQLPASFLV
jgi:hypothetical protein